MVLVYRIDGVPTIRVSTEHDQLIAEGNGGSMMNRARHRCTAAPAIGGWIVDFQRGAAAEAAGYVNLSIELGNRHFRASRWHGHSLRPLHNRLSHTGYEQTCDEYGTDGAKP